MKHIFTALLLVYLVTGPQIGAAAPAKESPITGVWKVISYQIIGYPAMTEAEANKWIGKLAVFSPHNQAILREKRSKEQMLCPEFAYQVAKQDAEGYFQVGYKVPPNRLGVIQTEVEVITLTCKGESWLGKSREFVKITDELMLSNWDGVFFFFARQADSLTLLSTQGASKVLFITPQSVGILTPDSDFNEATLKEGLHGYEVKPITHQTEGSSEVIEAFDFYRQGNLKLRVHPSRANIQKIGRVEIFDELARAPAYAKLGVTYSDVFKDYQQVVDCQAGIKDYSGKTLCNFKKMLSIKYVFEPKEEGKESPIDALNQAKLVGFIWFPDLGLVTEAVNSNSSPPVPVNPPAAIPPKAEFPVPAKVEVATPPVVAGSNSPKTDTKEVVAKVVDASAAPVPTDPEAGYKLQEEQLNEVYGRLKEALKIAGNEGSEGPVNLTNFVNAQTAWVDYRDKNCVWQLSLKDKKIADKSFACLERMTRDRVGELKQLLEFMNK